MHIIPLEQSSNNLMNQPWFTSLTPLQSCFSNDSHTTLMSQHSHRARSAYAHTKMAHIDPTFTTSTSCQHSADEVSQFIVTEAGWNTPAAAVTFFFDIPGLEVVTAADESEPDLLAATAMAVPTFAPVAPSGLAYFVFNVVVAKRQRRQGLARRIVSELIALCERRG